MNTTPDSDPVLVFGNLTLGYDRHPAVHHLDCEIARGALLAVVGPNGAGKSTLLKAIAGELEPLEGRYVLGVRRDRIAYLPQRGELELGFPLSVFDMVAMGLWRRLGAFGALGRDEATRVHDVLAHVGLSGLENRPVGTLSGGQLQRARFARLMLQDAELLLLDEPFNAIDTRTTEDLCALILGWHGEGRSIVAVLHDMELVRRTFPQCLLLAREPLGFGPTESVLTPELLSRARVLAESFDEDAPVCHRHEHGESA
ncbi:metal ABC transporter ATP-binding protein [Pseudazoarcus pumilus]|uniref:ABC transporter n=1 Tax=Pseudazoarcus pumilus TaxID=2067960 RepID=A0A2I6S3U3_9RHOO|nr:ABC transporter ATP-binding protein [Pseudazoarcus pumilus]AUN93922.1 ABC transporter [Pseudazoarcus pumilus]